MKTKSIVVYGPSSGVRSPAESCYQLFTRNDGLNMNASLATPFSRRRYRMLGPQLESLFCEAVDMSERVIQLEEVGYWWGGR